MAFGKTPVLVGVLDEKDVDAAVDGADDHAPGAVLPPLPRARLDGLRVIGHQKMVRRT
jgi:hypothetical protein